MLILSCRAQDFPIVDYHVHLKAGLTIEDAVRESHRLGIRYGIAANCGLLQPVTDDAGAERFLNSLKGQPVYIAMQAEGREWVHMFSKETVAKFDYVFTDSMTFHDDSGHRMRLWIKDEVPEIKDKQAFMEMLVSRTVGILNNEPIDIYVNPTFLPEVIAAEYDQLWTPARMQKVIDAAKKNGVAIEINNRYRIPSLAFIKQAKKAGITFSCGTNNNTANLGQNEYCVEMIKAAGLRAGDFFVPKPDGQKPVQRRGL